MIKKLVLLVLSVGCVVAVFMTDYSLTNTIDRKNKLENTSSLRVQSKEDRDNSVRDLNNALESFESSRTFDIHYTDVVRLRQLVDAVTGVSYFGIYEVDMDSGYMLGGQLDINSYAEGGKALPSALCLSVVAEDTTAGLRVIDKLQLPIVSITTSEPGRIDIIFLTGGDA